MSDSSSVSSAKSASTNDNVSDAAENWEVQDILAERQTLSGETEVLVDWKCTWVPISLVKIGPVLIKWRQTNKFRTGHEAMDVALPVVRGTQLHKDCIIIRMSHGNRLMAQRNLAAKHTGKDAGSSKKKASATKKRRA
jgi:hypothetical protein